LIIKEESIVCQWS